MAYDLVGHAARAAAKRAAGRGFDLTLDERMALARVQADLGLARPLESYAPRTRSRYLAAARRGETASHARVKERATRGSRAAQVELMRVRLAHSTLNPKFYTPEAIEALKNAYGVSGTAAILTAQIDAIVAYGQSHTRVGGENWAQRDAIVAQYRTALSVAPTTDPYFYYHASLTS